MADDIMALEERLARLEITVATGFSEVAARIDHVETSLRGEIGSVESRLRVLIEANHDEQRTMAEAYGATLERIDARLDRMHQEHRQAHEDHARAMQDHERRITALERHRRGPRSRS